ncbi:tRNA pseudouridine(55) synthase TruB [Carboxylicivirga mesophila]|uniref:tRNA pseudouridine synthase B n=1 Tax=Carboxylicivirga mesophila TaxID=1166478 RepID=A0ABS5KCN5_9BACT|nr:tRNA pseudouridine(55) synthase TruB [Carboxylicivirga mesophila]MBS2212587.1 tRNA pseudouridine(55) synthase TruB [Carboxylicivirga mesophila]
MHIEYSEERFREGQVLLINKPLEWTSFDIVNKIRLSLKRYLGIKKIKVGHAGTLDPLATGLVIVCTGKATKQIDQFLGMDKQYTADVRLGATTPSFDLEMEPDKHYPYEHITDEMVHETIARFTGEIEQIPPMFSALKVNGQKAYELARKGKEIELKARKINISELNILSWSNPDLKLDVSCSKGTYIRSLARDIGFDLNSGAHLTGLIRTRIGPYQLVDSITIEDFEKNLATFATK